MAIVDAGKDLLDQDCSIFLSELSSSDDFVKELTSFADPNELLIEINYSVTR
jgi:hypothetical protein